MSGRDSGNPLCGIDIPSANAERPRKVRFDSLSVKALSVALLMLLFGTGILIWISYGTITDLHVRHVLRRDGRTARGDITKSSENRGGELVRYAFSVEGVLYSGQAEMEANDYTLPGDRNRILIRYLPNDPHVNQPVNWQWVSVWDFFPFLLVLSITALGGRITLKALRLKTLMRIGTVALGTVTASVPKKNLFTVYYEFTAEDDTNAEGSCDLLDQYEVGTLIPVIYLRSDPKRNSRFPVGGFRIAERGSLPGGPGALDLGTGDSKEST